MTAALRGWFLSDREQLCVVRRVKTLSSGQAPIRFRKMGDDQVHKEPPSFQLDRWEIGEP